MIVDQPVSPENSTVLGYTYKEAPHLWESLVWDGDVFIDPSSLPRFDYLHVTALLDDDEEVSYRVRPRWRDGMWFPKPRRRVRTARVFQRGGKWHWRFVLED